MITMMSIMLPRASVAAKRINEVMDTKVSILDAMQEHCRTKGQKVRCVSSMWDSHIRVLMRRRLLILIFQPIRGKQWHLSEVQEAARVRW